MYSLKDHNSFISSKRSRRLVLIMALAAGIVLVLCVRLTVYSANHYYSALQAEEAGRIDAALKLYGRAIRQYYPGNYFAAKSVERSLELVKEFQINNQPENARNSLNDLKSVLLSTRSFYQPYSDSLEWIRERLTQIEENKYGSDSKKDASS